MLSFFKPLVKVAVENIVSRSLYKLAAKYDIKVCNYDNHVNYEEYSFGGTDVTEEDSD